MHIFFFLGHAHFIQPSEVKGKKKERKRKNVLLSMEWGFYSFALILPPPHPWHHTPWCHSPWGCAEGHNFSVVLISSTAAQLQKQQLWGEAGREGISFPKTQLQPSLWDTSTWDRHCPALAGALPGLARLNGQWWWNTY